MHRLLLLLPFNSRKTKDEEKNGNLRKMSDTDRLVDASSVPQEPGLCDWRSFLAVACVIVTFVSMGIPLTLCEQDRIKLQNRLTAMERTSVPPLADSVFFRIPIHMQETDYTCGPSSLLSVLYACRLASNATLVEAQLADAVGTTSSWGTNWTSLVHYAMSINNGTNLSVRVQMQMTPGDLRRALSENSDVVIIGYQAWKDPDEYYPLTWDDGHYSVVTGYNTSGFVLMDPWQNRGYNTSVNAYGFMTDEMLMRRWHYNNGGIYNGLPLYGLGLSMSCTGVASLKEEDLPVGELRMTW